MKREKIVINTLVLLEDLKSGVPQSLIMDKVNDIGIKNVEIRREFIKNFNEEVLNIREKANKYNMRIFYSVPELLFKANKLRVKEIEGFFNEAYNMSSHNIKMIIGEIDELTEEDVNIINDLCEKYSIELTVENDQTPENGRVEKIYNFLKRNKELGGNISFTFDVGNWIFQDEDPIKNAERLKEFVTYVHLKNATEDRKNTLIDKGILNIEKILINLPNNLPMALEYPCNSIEEINSEIEKILKF
ncbi:sugar phosphate isomerase/epimerase [Clostridium nigeriense]|uniref:sugar phosphate isomerase/epimerase family protein n=1 Tax=Clostridium nigeriense TaxID=1805470 RepID=UPI00082C24FD|nr:TIM barrel protein [Clostridium nigeriense]